MISFVLLFVIRFCMYWSGLAVIPSFNMWAYGIWLRHNLVFLMAWHCQSVANDLLFLLKSGPIWVTTFWSNCFLATTSNEVFGLCSCKKAISTYKAAQAKMGKSFEFGYLQDYNNFWNFFVVIRKPFLCSIVISCSFLKSVMIWCTNVLPQKISVAHILS